MTQTQYRVRFIPDTPEARAELVNLFHLARTAVGNDRLDRKVWASQQYHHAHPEVTGLAAYKDLDGLLSW
jgi:hypothetical protein